jgi:hypothetical protein
MENKRTRRWGYLQEKGQLEAIIALLPALCLDLEPHFFFVLCFDDISQSHPQQQHSKS